MSVKSFKTGTRTFSMLAGNVPEHHVLIAESTVGAGGAASVTFSNIPADYQHLQIRGISADTYSAGNWSFATVRFNSDSGNNYAMHTLYGTGAVASSEALSTTASGRFYIGNNSQFGAVVLDVLDYTSTSKNKTVRQIAGNDNNGSGIVTLGSSLWYATPAIITSISIAGGNGNLRQHSTFQLYGVK